jgi:hypothetical protein
LRRQGIFAGIREDQLPATGYDSERMPSPRRAAVRSGRLDPERPPFSGFFERDAGRERRERGRRWTIVLSLGAHVVGLLALLLYSLFHVDDLFGPSVEVKMFAPSAAPSGADHENNPDWALR